MKTWLECDKGWFGIPIRHKIRTFDYAEVFLCDGSLQVGNTIPLHKMMSWAERHDIPYEITTVKPNPIPFGLQNKLDKNAFEHENKRIEMELELRRQRGI